MRPTSPTPIRVSRGTSTPRMPQKCSSSDSTSCVSASSGRRSSRDQVVPTSRRSALPGRPGNAHEWNRAVAERYLSHVAATVKLLARYGIYTLLDMHQDVYNQNFRGEGAPDWAVCTNNVPIVPKGGRWSNNYSNPHARRRPCSTSGATTWWGTSRAISTWSGRPWPQYFKNDPWVIGYDPYNEPFSTETQTASESTFTGQLECFYIGKAHTGHLANGASPLTCPPGDPDNGVIPTIQSRRQSSPDLRGAGHLLGDRREHPFPAGPAALRRASSSISTSTAATAARSRATRPTCSSACSPRRPPRPNRTSPAFPWARPTSRAGPAIFMSEFGATTSVALAGFDAEWAGLDQLGWIYWAWKYYDDPTGSSAEGLVQPDGTYSPIVTVLSRTYPQEVAGDPNSVIFNPSPVLQHGRMRRQWQRAGSDDHRRRGVAALPRTGGARRSRADASPRSPVRRTSPCRRSGTRPQVYVTVTAGSCPS